MTTVAMSTPVKLTVTTLLISVVSCRQMPSGPGSQGDGRVRRFDKPGVEDFTGTLRPDANTILLVTDSMTFRRVSPRKDGTNAVNYFMLETEVTNEMYARYLNATKRAKGDQERAKQEGRRREKMRLTGAYFGSTAAPIYDFKNVSLLWNGNTPPRGRKQFPVAFLTIGDAKEFCQWLTSRYPQAGCFRLPTVQEWVFAAYGETRKYPWGDERDLTVPCVSLSAKDLRTTPTPVKTHAKDRTPEGIYDLGGNVAEFVLDLKVLSFDTRWMGASFKTYPFGKEGHPFKPRNDYWGYCHGAASRMEDIGFRVLLELTE